MSPNDSNGSNSAFREPDKTRNPSYCIHGVQDDSKDNKKWCGVVTSRRALDAALVLDNQTTHEDHFSCDRDGKPTCSHVAQPVCPQVPCDVHTNTATLILGLPQPSKWEDRNQVRNEGGTGSASLKQRAMLVGARRARMRLRVGAHSATGPQRPFCKHCCQHVATATCLARHAATHLAAPCCAGAAPLRALHRTQRTPSARPARPPAPSPA